jgi:hypothetical protein
MRALWRPLSAAQARLAAALFSQAAVVCDFIYRHRQPGGLLLRSWPTGSMALWVMVMLLANLVFFYLG